MTIQDILILQRYKITKESYLLVEMGRRLPDRWLQYKPVCEKIDRFIAFKVPLNQSLLSLITESNDVRFGWKNLSLYLHQNSLVMGLVVDLCNTDRYYEPSDLSVLGNEVFYQKLYCEGHDQLPSEDIFERFIFTMQRFRSFSDGLIGVHCTHGVNRTGFLICKYLILCQAWEPSVAIEMFESSRGHKFDKQFYVDHLLALNPGNRESDICENDLKGIFLPVGTPRYTSFDAMVPIKVEPGPDHSEPGPDHSQESGSQNENHSDFNQVTGDLPQQVKRRRRPRKRNRKHNKQEQFIQVDWNERDLNINESQATAPVSYDDSRFQKSNKYKLKRHFSESDIAQKPKTHCSFAQKTMSK